MKKENKTLKETWMAILDRDMTKEQLLLIVYSREDYSQEFRKLVKETLAQKYGITEKELKSLPEKGRIVNGTIGTRDLLIETLQKMGCESYNYFLDEEEMDNECDLVYSYENKSFVVRAHNDSEYVILWNQCCYSINMYDKNKLERLQVVMNMLNDSSSATLFYEVDERFQVIRVLAKVMFLFIPQIPNLDFYLYDQIYDIHHAEELLREEMEKLE